MSYKKILLTCLCIILNGITLSKNNIEFESDSIPKKELDEKIKYFANDSIIYDLEHNVIKLYNKAKVIYNKINLEAFGYNEFSDVKARMQNNSDGYAVFNDQESTFLIFGVSVNDLNEQDFILWYKG